MGARRSRLTTLIMTPLSATTPLSARQRLLAIGLVLAVSLVAFEVTALFTALPTIADELDGDSLYGVSLAVYTLANMVSLVAAGELADKRGPAVPFMIAVAVFIAGLLVAAAAPTMSWIVVGRVLQGAGTGAFNPISYSLVRRAFPTDRQPMMYAFLSAGWVLPSLVAPLIAGWITDRFGWRWVFLGIVPPALAVAVLAVRPMFDHRPVAQPAEPSRVPLAIAAAVGVGALVTALQFDRWPVAVLTSAAGIALAAPALRRLLPRGYATIVPGFAAVLVARTCATSSFGGVDGFIPLAADRIHSATPVTQGFVIIGAAVTWTIGQWIRARAPHRPPARSVAEGFVFMAAGAILSTPVLLGSWPLWATFISWSLGGLGMGLLFNPTTVTAMGYATAGAEGRVSSQLALADSVGWSLMAGLGGAAVAAADRGSISVAPAIGSSFAVAIAAAIAGIAVSRRIRPAA